MLDRQDRRRFGTRARSRAGLILKMGREIRSGWRLEALLVGGANRALEGGGWVAVEHEPPVLSFPSVRLCYLAALTIQPLARRGSRRAGVLELMPPTARSAGRLRILSVCCRTVAVPGRLSSDPLFDWWCLGPVSPARDRAHG
jgi:hypothetical protein